MNVEFRILVWTCMSGNIVAAHTEINLRQQFMFRYKISCTCPNTSKFQDYNEFFRDLPVSMINEKFK